MFKQRASHPTKDEWYYSSSHIPSDVEVYKTLPYRYEEFNKDSVNVVYIVEGEKCADAMINAQLPATTSINPSKPSVTDWSVLMAKKKVIYIPDTDQQGKEKTKLLLAELKEAGVGEVKVVDTTHAKSHFTPREGKTTTDVADWLTQTDKLPEGDFPAQSLLMYIREHIRTVEEFMNSGDNKTASSSTSSSSSVLSLNDPVHEETEQGATLALDKDDDNEYMDYELLKMKEYQGHKVSHIYQYTNLAYIPAVSKYLITAVELVLEDGTKVFFESFRNKFTRPTKKSKHIHYYYRPVKKGKIVIICETEEEVDLCYKNGFSSLCWRGKTTVIPKEGMYASMYREITRDPSTSVWVWGQTANRTKKMVNALIHSGVVDVVPYTVIKSEIVEGSTHEYETDYTIEEHFATSPNTPIPTSNNMIPLVSYSEDLSRVSKSLKIELTNSDKGSVIVDMPRSSLDRTQLVEICLNLYCNKECRGSSGGNIEYRDLNQTNIQSAWREPEKPDSLIEEVVNKLHSEFVYRKYKKDGEFSLSKFNISELKGFVSSFFRSCDIDATKEFFISLPVDHPEWNVPKEDLLVNNYLSVLFKDSKYDEELQELLYTYNLNLTEKEVKSQVKEYVQFVTSLPLVSVVLRTFYPGCNIKQTLLLCGEQGAGKSAIFDDMWPVHLKHKFRGGRSELVSPEKKVYMWKGASMVEYADTIFKGSRAEEMAKEVKIDRRASEYTVRVPYDTRETTFKMKCGIVRTCNPVEGVTGTDSSGSDDTVFYRVTSKCPLELHDYFSKSDNRTRLWIGAVRLAREIAHSCKEQGKEKVALVVDHSIMDISEKAIAAFVPDRESEFRDESTLANSLDNQLRSIVSSVPVYKIGRSTGKIHKSITLEDTLKHSNPRTYEKVIQLSGDGKIDGRNLDVRKFKSAMKRLGLGYKNYQVGSGKRMPIFILTDELITKYGLDDILVNKPVSVLNASTFDAIEGDTQSPEDTEDLVGD